MLAVLSLCHSVQAEPGPDISAREAFDTGVELVRGGRFEEALRYFLTAYAQGDQSPRLQFNLGVAYYRLHRFHDARTAFLRAAASKETADLSIYNVGLVAFAAGDRAEAAKRFRYTAKNAKSANLRALAAKALARTNNSEALRARGSVSVLRGEDSNVIIPVGTGNDLASNQRDSFLEGRLAWADTFGDSERWGYRVSGVHVEYDDLSDGNISFAEAGVDFRGPVSAQLGMSALLVADEAYQQTTDLRVRATVFNRRAFAAAYELGYSLVDAMGSGPEQLEGNRYYFGIALDARSKILAASLGVRKITNDRELAALSPDQVSVSAGLRAQLVKGVVARLTGRYTDSKYKNDRQDELLELGAEISFRLYKGLALVVEAARYENRSSVAQLRYETDKIYGGLRLQF